MQRGTSGETAKDSVNEDMTCTEVYLLFDILHMHEPNFGSYVSLTSRHSSKHLATVEKVH